MTRAVRVTIVALTLTAWTEWLSAQTPSEPLTITVTDEATLTVKPDEAQIDVGVTTQADTSETATHRNAQQTSAVIAAIRAGIGSNATVDTVSYRLSPDYRHPREGGEPAIVGYTATNIVRVTLRDLSRVGDAIDVATKAGANRIHRITFTLANDDAARAEVLRAAAAKAKARADTLASALGVRIVRVLSATTGSDPPVRPFVADAALRAESAMTATPIHPGTIDVHAAVTLTVEISDAPRTAGLP